MSSLKVNFFNVDPVNLFLVTDKNNLSNLKTTIKMVVYKSSSTRKYNIHILYNYLLIKNKKEILKLVAKENFDIIFLKINEGKFVSVMPEDTPHKSKVARFKFIIGELNITKALYLDTDILIRKDIARLFDIDLKGYILAAVPDVNSRSFNENLDLPKHFNYFNTGVLLINCDKWKRLGISNQLLKCAILNEKIINFVDQDTFNIVFSKLGYKILDLAWNLPSAKQYFNFNYLTYCNIFRNSYNYYQILRSFLTPNLVHFIGVPKPNKQNVQSAYAKEYIKYIE